jgi:hypothetical protein
MHDLIFLHSYTQIWSTSEVTKINGPRNGPQGKLGPNLEPELTEKHVYRNEN